MSEPYIQNNKFRDSLGQHEPRRPSHQTGDLVRHSKFLTK